MRIALLTSSRADYGIYMPLIDKIRKDSFFTLKIIAFGTHLSALHGNTVQEIENDGLQVAYKVESLIVGDSPEAISTAMASTLFKFASLWAILKKDIDLIICLGDRYEMLSAVLASIPFQIPIAHIHGGETTLGAMDNIFRHTISLSAHYHFVAAEIFKDKIIRLTDRVENVYCVGALGLDNLSKLTLLSIEDFKAKYCIDISLPTILFTFHPETASYQKNEFYIQELVAVLTILSVKYQIIITMPNADTLGGVMRNYLKIFSENQKNTYIIESFGTLGYFSCMKHCSFLMGNSSSGIIEAASFRKYVINLGDRQKGRLSGKNVIHLPIERIKILEMVEKIEQLPKLDDDNIYGKGNASEQIVQILKHLEI